MRSGNIICLAFSHAVTLYFHQVLQVLVELGTPVKSSCRSPTGLELSSLHLASLLSLDPSIFSMLLTLGADVFALEPRNGFLSLLACYFIIIIIIFIVF
jgi:hypothetical protein